MASIRNLFMGMPPMLDALAQQTDVKLPSFFPQVGLPSNYVNILLRWGTQQHAYVHADVKQWPADLKRSRDASMHWADGLHLQLGDECTALLQVKAQEPINGSRHVAARNWRWCSLAMLYAREPLICMARHGQRKLYTSSAYSRAAWQLFLQSCTF
jgi:hypothetical protein